jgi:protein TonB
LSATPAGGLEYPHGSRRVNWTDTANRISVEICPEIVKTAAKSAQYLALYGVFADGRRRVWTVLSCAPLTQSDRPRADLIGIATAGDPDTNVLASIGFSISPMLLVSINGDTFSLELWMPGTGERRFLTVLSQTNSDGDRAGRGRVSVRFEVPQWVWAVSLFLAAAALTGHFYTKLRETPLPPVENAQRARVAYGFGMHATRMDNKLDVQWDPNAPGLHEADSGVLKVTDGDQLIAVPLAAKDIASGHLTYVPRSDSLGLELSVDTRVGPISERVRVELPKGLPPVVQPVAAAQPARTLAITTPQQPSREVEENSQETVSVIPQSSASRAEPAPDPPAAKQETPPLAPAPNLVASALPRPQQVTPIQSPIPAALDLRPPAQPAVTPRAAVLVPAAPVRQVSPIVPETLRKIISNRVTVEVTVRIAPDGSVAGVQIPQYKGIAAHLAESAAIAARSWRFKPATRDGQPVESLHLIRFNFDRNR